MREEDESNIRGGETDMDLYTPVDSLVMPWTPPFKFEVTSVFDSKGHKVCDLRGWGFLSGKGAGACGLDMETAGKIQNQMGEHIASLLNMNMDSLVNKFLAWPLPDSVCSDLCATRENVPHRSGTNLLSAIEARQMLEHLFKA